MGRSRPARVKAATPVEKAHARRLRKIGTQRPDPAKCYGEVIGCLWRTDDHAVFVHWPDHCVCDSGLLHSPSRNYPKRPTEIVHKPHRWLTTLIGAAPDGSASLLTSFLP